MGIKNFLKKFYPIPTRSFYNEMNRIHTEIAELTRIVKTETEQQHSEISVLRNQLSAVEKSAMESIWANVFHDTTSKSNWLTDKAFWPGRSALGYQAMYVTYRILNEINPKRILELGLGQSTKLISQYVRANSDVTHYVVENNQDWINFFSAAYPLPPSTKIEKLDWKIIPYKDGEVRIFDGFSKRFKEEKFDFIMVDAPLGADMKQYSRVDVLEIIPESLSENFVILIDDTDRLGEQNTISEIKKKLEKNGIKFCEGWYNGAKNSTVVCSQALGFLTTM